MSLFIQHYGTPDKPRLVLLHGWGMNADIWTDWAALLAEDFYLICPDLPGLGRSSQAGDDSLSGLCQKLLDGIAAVDTNPAQPAIWLGWSLGGLLAMKAAELYPDRVSAVITVATNPCFVAREDWPHAMDIETYSQFQQGVKLQPAKTLQRFCGLMVQGEENPRGLLKQLKQLLREAPVATALDETLQLLEEDQREGFANSSVSAEHWFAEADALVPVTAASFLPAKSWVIEGAGHAPFLSQPQRCADRLKALAAAWEADHG